MHIQYAIWFDLIWNKGWLLKLEGCNGDNYVITCITTVCPLYNFWYREWHKIWPSDYCFQICCVDKRNIFIADFIDNDDAGDTGVAVSHVELRHTVLNLIPQKDH